VADRLIAAEPDLTLEEIRVRMRSERKQKAGIGSPVAANNLVKLLGSVPREVTGQRSYRVCGI
jgi:hypothetical protein